MSVITQTTEQNLSPKPQWTVFEIVFGIALPIFCIVADFGVLGLAVIAPVALWGTAAIGITAFAMSNVNLPDAVRELIIGILVVGGLVATIIGLMLLPMSLIGILFFGLGLLGFIP